MRVAAVDVGTNTIEFLIADTGPWGLRAVHEHTDIVRLGQGVDRTGLLTEEAMGRAITALAACGRYAAALGVERLGAVGTQALREAHNGAVFLARARAILGVDLEVIGGEREARLSWLAAAASFPLSPGRRRTVLDIGGGSTELALGPRPGSEARHGGDPDALVSIPIGSVRLTERCLAHDPPTDEERAQLVAIIDEALDRAPRPEGELVGIAGTVTTLCAIHLGRDAHDPARVHGTRLRHADVARLAEHLGRLSLAERRALRGLDPHRADVIYAGATILERVLARASTDEVIVSNRGVRWGLAQELADAPPEPPPA